MHEPRRSHTHTEEIHGHFKKMQQQIWRQRSEKARKRDDNLLIIQTLPHDLQHLLVLQESVRLLKLLPHLFELLPNVRAFPHTLHLLRVPVYEDPNARVARNVASDNCVREHFWQSGSPRVSGR